MKNTEGFRIIPVAILLLSIFTSTSYAADCDREDGWYMVQNLGVTCLDGKLCSDTILREYRDYGVSNGLCAYTLTETKTECNGTLQECPSGQVCQGGCVSAEATTTTPSIFCGNGKCETGENYANCPKDCKEKQKGIGDYLPYALALVFVLIIIFLAYKRLRERNVIKKEKKESEVIEWVKERLRGGEDPKILKEGLKREGVNPEIVDKAIENSWL